MRIPASIQEAARRAGVLAIWQGHSQSHAARESIPGAGSREASSRITQEAPGVADKGAAAAVLCLCLLLMMLCAGCSPGPRGGPENTEARRTFEARGVVREVATNRLQATIRHEEIPGYMPRMTMGLGVRDPKALEGVAPGDEVAFTLVVTADEHWMENIRKTGRREEIAPNAVAVPAGKARELRPGDEMPDFEFVGEDGVRTRLSSLRGRAVAFTFFFTRCPIPEYCPKMAKGFAQARELMIRRTDGPTNWQFVCLSFDAEFDRPQVLSAYAKAYRGSDARGWVFGAVEPATLAVVAPALDLIVTREASGFSHNLRTVVLDPEGRIRRQFDGNEWTAGELAEALAEALGTRSKNE